MKLTLSGSLIVALLPIFLGGCTATTGGGSLLQFTSENIQELALSPYYLSDPAEGGDHAWYMKLKISDGVPVAGFLKPNQMLTESLTNAISALKPMPGKLFAASTQASVEGCKGSYRVQVEPQSADEFKGSLTFHDYADDCSLVLNGQVPFAGKVTLPTGETTLALTLPPLSAQLAGKSLALSGRLSLEFNMLRGEKQLVITESNMIIADENGRRLSLSPVTFRWDGRGAYPKQVIEGQVAIAPYGVVRVETTSPLQISPTNKKPFDGSLWFHGANDGWVRLWFAKPGFPGFFRLDGPHDFETIGQL